MFSAMAHRRDRLVAYVQDYVQDIESQPESRISDTERALRSLLLEWLENRDEKSDKPTLLFDKMKPLFNILLANATMSTINSSLISKVWSERDMFPKLSQWIVGGDGWAYDIGFGR
jgi:pyruvate/2-oxoacid:ferredoxin oxidoreductase beta subunit